MDFIPEIIDQIRMEWQSAPQGYKAETIQKWAATLGCSYQKIYRLMPTIRNRKKGDRQISGVKEAARTVALIKKSPPKEKGELTTKDALRIALDNGVIPEEMKTVSVSTFNRLFREIGMDKRQRRVQRFQAEYPNQLHHIDASSSDCFYVARKMPDGDRVLKLHTNNKGYKNKPVPTRERPWIYGLADDHSGLHIARYVAALGESMADNLDFLCWAWSQKEDGHFFGLPDRLKSDHGPMMKGKAAENFIDRLGIDVDGSIPGHKEAHGKIERPWRTMWERFERPFFAESDWKGFEISLSELNRRFMIYQEEYNAMQHRYEKGVSRLDVWRRISLRGGAVAMPQDSLRTIGRRWERTVEADGCFSLDGERYEVKGLHAAKVYVYRGVFDNCLVVMDKATGKKYEVEDFAPTPLDTFVGHPETPHEKAVKESAMLEGVHNTLYQAPKDQGNVTQFPTRIKETREIENPMEVDAFPSMTLAMQEFTVICGFRLDQETRKDVEQAIRENSLSRRYVIDLAMEIQVELERSAQ